MLNAMLRARVAAMAATTMVAAVGCATTATPLPHEVLGRSGDGAAQVHARVALQGSPSDDGWGDGPGGAAVPGAPVRQFDAGLSFYYGTDFGYSTAFVIDPYFGWGFEKGLAVYARLSYYQYEYDDGDSLAPGNFHEEEEGSGFGLGGEVRWYVKERAFDGFYIGAGLGLYPAADWENKEDVNGDGVFQPIEIDDGTDVSFEIHGTLGYTIRIETRVGITPAIVFGHYTGDAGPGPFIGAGIQGSIAFP